MHNLTETREKTAGASKLARVGTGTIFRKYYPCDYVVGLGKAGAVKAVGYSRLKRPGFRT